MSEVKNVSGDEYKLNCIKCGSAKGLEMVAHRNGNKGVTGYLFTCQECKTKVLGHSIAEVFGLET